MIFFNHLRPENKKFCCSFPGSSPIKSQNLFELTRFDSAIKSETMRDKDIYHCLNKKVRVLSLYWFINSLVYWSFSEGLLGPQESSFIFLITSNQQLYRKLVRQVLKVYNCFLLLLQGKSFAQYFCVMPANGQKICHLAPASKFPKS